MKEIYGERVDEYKDASLARYEKVAKDYELDWEDFVKQVFGLEVDEFDIEIVQYASEMVKQEMIIYSIAEKEGIEITEDELDDFIMQQLNNSGYKDRADFEAQSGMSIEVYIKNNNMVLNVYLNKELGIIYDRLTGR